MVGMARKRLVLQQNSRSCSLIVLNSNQIITTRSQAKELGLRHYFTGKPCVRGHVEKRFTSTGQCSICMNGHSEAWRKANPEKISEAQAQWRAKQPKPPKKPSISKTRRELNRKYRLKKRGFPNANMDIRCIPLDPMVQWEIYYEKQKDKIAQKQLEYRQRNRDALKQAWIEWYSKNRVSQIEKSAMRRKKVLMATPAWLTNEQRKQITEIYFLSIKLSEKTGILHHVDHIVPISGKNVCGLHVPWNLRAIPANDNLSKSNKLIDAA